MRCNICDRLLAAPRYNRELKAWEPCDTCLEIINECLNDFKDNAVFTEEDDTVALEDAGIPPENIQLSFFT